MFEFDLHNHLHQHIDTEKEDKEFDFWSSHQATDDENSSSNVASYNEEYDFNDYSPSLLTRYASRSIESSPLLRHNNSNYDQISPRKRSQAIAEGRKELMEMVRNMPESSYELSLKDLVDEKEEEKQEEVVSDQEASFRFCSNKEQTKSATRKKTKSVHKSVKMSRSGSMEKESFLIKMFIPSFSWKTKEKASRLCSSVSFDGSEEHMGDGWSLKRLLVSGKGKDSRNSSNSSNSRLCRHGKSPGCWSFICINKSKERESLPFKFA